jgi:hypothetical protein
LDLIASQHRQALPNYARDWHSVEKIARATGLSVKLRWSKSRLVWVVSLWKPGKPMRPAIEDESLPRAVCLAALEWHKQEVKL